MDDAAAVPAQSQRAQQRLVEIRAEISGRLWPVNAGMSSASFNELMNQMSLLQLNFELRASGVPGQIDTRAGASDRRGFAPFAPLGGFSPPGTDTPDK